LGGRAASDPSAAKAATEAALLTLSSRMNWLFPRLRPRGRGGGHVDQAQRASGQGSGPLASRRSPTAPKSALPLRSDIQRQPSNVRLGPQADITSAGLMFTMGQRRNSKSFQRLQAWIAKFLASCRTDPVTSSPDQNQKEPFWKGGAGFARELADCLILGNISPRIA